MRSLAVFSVPWMNTMCGKWHSIVRMILLPMKWPSREPFVGIEAFKKGYADVFQGYPDCKSEVTENYADGNAVICQVRWWATNLGVFRGAVTDG